VKSGLVWWETKVEKVFSLRFVYVCPGAGSVGSRGSGLTSIPGLVRVSNLEFQASMLSVSIERGG